MSIDSNTTDTQEQKRKVEPNALEEQSISALRSKARKKHIDGRSTMNKVELIMALRQAR